METQHVTHETINARYRVTIERAASSTKNVIGCKVEANGDLLTGVIEQVKVLKDAAELIATEPAERFEAVA